mgnify:CR=1 FL=1
MRPFKIKPHIAMKSFLRTGSTIHRRGIGSGTTLSHGPSVILENGYYKFFYITNL